MLVCTMPNAGWHGCWSLRGRHEEKSPPNDLRLMIVRVYDFLHEFERPYGEDWEDAVPIGGVEYKLPTDNAEWLQYL
jgi:hypothetical protein